MPVRFCAAALLLATLAWASAASAPALGQTTADFYKDRTVTIMVPAKSDDVLAVYARLLTAHLGRHIPGKPAIKLVSMPGAGGTKGSAHAYNAAPRDGTYIAQITPSAVLAPALQKPGYDTSRFQWLGSIARRPAVVSVWHGAPVKTLDDARTMPAILGSMGKMSETAMIPRLMNALLGTRFRIVKGYRSASDMDKAMEQGEIQGRLSFWSGAERPGRRSFKKDNLVHLMQYGPRIGSLPDVPSFRDAVSTDEHKRMVAFMELGPWVGVGFWLAPAVPQSRVRALRTAFRNTMNSPSFIAAATRRRLPVNPISGTKLQRMVAEGYDMPAAAFAALRNALGFAPR
jgi:tripartite-type tricarboxylate transporter receptor subunit TctC